MPGQRRGRKAYIRIAKTLLVGTALLQSSCGTMLYPERHGQPRGRLDVGVVAMNGLGLVLFLVPGVIAFAVDFATGAIYLPAEPQPDGVILGPAPHQVNVEPGDLTNQRLETVVREHTGKTVNLQPGTYKTKPIQKLDEVTPETISELEANVSRDTIQFPTGDK